MSAFDWIEWVIHSSLHRKFKFGFSPIACSSQFSNSEIIWSLCFIFVSGSSWWLIYRYYHYSSPSDCPCMSYLPFLISSALYYYGSSRLSLNPSSRRNTLFMSLKLSSTILLTSILFIACNSIINRSVHDFPSLDETPSLFLSVIVPAYNEEFRLPKMLDECIPYLINRTKSNPYVSFGCNEWIMIVESLPGRLLW